MKDIFFRFVVPIIAIALIIGVWFNAHWTVALAITILWLFAAFGK